MYIPQPDTSVSSTRATGLLKMYSRFFFLIHASSLQPFMIQVVFNEAAKPGRDPYRLYIQCSDEGDRQSWLAAIRGEVRDNVVRHETCVHQRFRRSASCTAIMAAGRSAFQLSFRYHLTQSILMCPFPSLRAFVPLDIMTTFLTLHMDGGAAGAAEITSGVSLRLSLETTL